MNRKIYEYIEDMLEFKESLGYARRTYEGFLNDYRRYLMKLYPEASSLTEEIALGWCVKRNTEKASGYRRRVLVLREFSKYLFSIDKSDYILPSDYTARQSRYTPYIFSDKELIAIFHASDCVEMQPYYPYRETIIPVMIKLIYFCGLRPNEGREIQSKDVDLNDGILFIRKNKSHRERRIPMTDDITDMCRSYWNQISMIYPDSLYFFPSSTGKPYSAKWLTRQFLMLWNKIKASDNTARVRVYDLRHRYATAVMMKWLDEGEDLYACLPYLSSYMGHSKFSDTAYYIHLMPEKLVHSESIDWKHFLDLIPEVYENE
jgi:integrase